MQDSQLLDIVLIVVAGVVLFRLYSVLGRRTGNERPRGTFSRWTRPQPASNAGEGVVNVPESTPANVASARDAETDPVARGLLDLKLADKGFDTDKFLSGAKAAYEMILTAFAQGDRATLRPLLSEEVYAAFDGVVRTREQKKEKVDFTFVGFKDVKIVQAGVKGRNGEVTVAFGAQFISATRDEGGHVSEGDTKTVRDVTDVWTFSRDARSRDPNWLLVATSGDLP
jgi:predicted lipid-binding transport protein (Tim44 family)